MAETKRTTYDLPAHGIQKSFYGKAFVIDDGNGSPVLYSYRTPVATIDSDGNLARLWGSWSVTTSKHINAFCMQYNLPTVNKAVWCSMPVRYHELYWERKWN